MLGKGEWVMNNDKMTVSDYEKLPAQFNPTEFNAAEWVAMAKAAGMKYITITSRHHDGFAMFDSKISDWNIVQRTPYKKDVMKASTMLEHDAQWAVILAFDVKIEKDAQAMADELGVRIFRADIIYHLQDAFIKHR